MNLRGIGGHTTSLVGLSEFTPITMITGEEKEIHLFIAKGAVHTILGRPFLADNNVKLEFSHKQGEIFSYPEKDRHQLCLPICNPQAMGWQISPPSGIELCASSEIGKWSVHQAESPQRKETEETESQSSTRVKTIFLGPNKIPFLNIFAAKNDLNFITQEISLKAELNISPYTSKSTDNSLKPIGQIENLEVTFESVEKPYLDFLVFENFNKIINEEKSSILSSAKETIPDVTHIKSKGKETEDKLEVEGSEAIEKIKEELKKMRRNLDIAIEDPEKWLALELSGMNKEDKVESPQKKFKMDLKPPEASSPGIEDNYYNLFQEEAWYISDTDKDFLSEELKDNIINPLSKRKFEELEKETESEDDLKLYQQNNGYLEDKYKQGRIFEDLEEGDLSENTQRLAGLSILEEFDDAYDQICYLSSSTDLFNRNQGITPGLPNDSQNQNGIQKDIPEYEGLEDYVILPIIRLKELYDYELDSPIIQTEYLSELPGSNLTNVDFLELLTTMGIKGNLQSPYWKERY
ncbi:hypothetical protein O181_109093 [Austropuccinia psidii MF-1]|uniref:Uncharacterized protein n=1 Tax=Austropuccinia psidii MF-1 TaxID=1389203 RepID=A0A9Q3JU30_9BASI|nr:hypothetical protein [Austropuccinia psidii MF-1]